MELENFWAVLAWLQLLPWLVSSEGLDSSPELPPAPWIALAPRYPVFLPGERVTLWCSARSGEMVARYRFYRHPGELTGNGVPDSRRGIQLDLSAGPGTAGLYVCVYWAVRAGREVSSKESRPVAVSLTDRPPKPLVSLAPDFLVYMSGDRLEILCLAPPTASLEWFSFYESGKVIGPEWGNTSTWQLDLQHINTGNATRSFSCTYEQRIQGRLVPSHASDLVSIPVFLAPAAPSLRLTLAHPLYVTGETVMAECVIPAGPYEPRAHWLHRDEEPGAETPGPHCAPVSPSPAGAERGPPSGAMSEGALLLLTCRAPGGTSQWRFHFYQDGAKLSTQEPSASPERCFPQATPSQAEWEGDA